MDTEKKLFPLDAIDVKNFKFSREIRDPIYDYIHITHLENKLIDTPAFQRLDRIYQNPVVRFVYPNATHTRKAHSLGVMHLYHKALLTLLYHQSPDFRKRLHPLYSVPTTETKTDVLQRLDQNIGNAWWDSKTFIEILQTGRVVALLHDLGHGPFSHLFETVCDEISKQDTSFKFEHEEMSAKIISSELSSFFTDTITEEGVISLMKKGKQRWFLQELLDGPFDVDKLDYINRDSYHAGTKEYGSIDYERLIDGFRVRGEKLFISKSAIGALMSTFNALQLAYVNIYYHKTCRVFDHMIIEALRNIPDYIKDIALNVVTLLETDDITFLKDIKHKQGDDADGKKFEKSWEIITDVLNRKKRYSIIASHQITFAVVQSMREDLDALKIEYEPKYTDIKLVVDFTGGVKGLRIDPSRTFEWLIEANIIDEDDTANPAKNLKTVSGPYYNALKQEQILLYLFVDRKIKDEGTKEARINKAKSEIAEEIHQIERKQELVR